MRRYHVEVGGKTHVIDVNEVTAHEFQVVVGNQEFTVKLSSAADIPETIISPEMGQVRSADRNGDGAHEPEPLSAARFRPPAPETLPSMVPMAPPRLPPSPDRTPGTVNVLKAPMPGTVTTVEVVAGAQVTTGQVLLKLEAMKMVNAIKSPREGVIADVPVRPGQSVGYGTVLVTFMEA
jgi:biotin carboxyl carrier protein